MARPVHLDTLGPVKESIPEKAPTPHVVCCPPLTAVPAPAIQVNGHVPTAPFSAPAVKGHEGDRPVLFTHTGVQLPLVSAHDNNQPPQG